MSDVLERLASWTFEVRDKALDARGLCEDLNSTLRDAESEIRQLRKDNAVLAAEVRANRALCAPSIWGSQRILARQNVAKVMADTDASGALERVGGGK